MPITVTLDWEEYEKLARDSVTSDTVYYDGLEDVNTQLCNRIATLQSAAEHSRGVLDNLRKSLTEAQNALFAERNRLAQVRADFNKLKEEFDLEYARRMAAEANFNSLKKVTEIPKVNIPEYPHNVRVGSSATSDYVTWNEGSTT